MSSFENIFKIYTTILDLHSPNLNIETNIITAHETLNNNLELIHNWLSTTKLRFVHKDTEVARAVKDLPTLTEAFEKKLIFGIHHGFRITDAWVTGAVMATAAVHNYNMLVHINLLLKIVMSIIPKYQILKPVYNGNNNTQLYLNLVLHNMTTLISLTQIPGNVGKTLDASLQIKYLKIIYVLYEYTTDKMSFIMDRVTEIVEDPLEATRGSTTPVDNVDIVTYYVPDISEIQFASWLTTYINIEIQNLYPLDDEDMMEYQACYVECYKICYIAIWNNRKEIAWKGDSTNPTVLKLYHLMTHIMMHNLYPFACRYITKDKGYDPIVLIWWLVMGSPIRGHYLKNFVKSWVSITKNINSNTSSYKYAHIIPKSQLITNNYLEYLEMPPTNRLTGGKAPFNGKLPTKNNVAHRINRKHVICSTVINKMFSVDKKFYLWIDKLFKLTGHEDKSVLNLSTGNSTRQLFEHEFPRLIIDAPPEDGINKPGINYNNNLGITEPTFEKIMQVSEETILNSLKKKDTGNMTNFTKEVLGPNGPEISPLVKIVTRDQKALERQTKIKNDALGAQKHIQSRKYWFGSPGAPSWVLKRPKKPPNLPRNGQRQGISCYNH